MSNRTGEYDIMLTRLSICLALVLMPSAVHAACAPETLGTQRVLTVDTRGGVRVGVKSYPQSLPLGPKEVVLTFDDGPWPATTPAILDALAKECVRATFFLIGQNAQSRPALVRRIAAEGHTIGHHTNSHPILRNMPEHDAVHEIETGIAAVEGALGHRPLTVPSTPFFRFPGFADTPALLDVLAKRSVAVFGADLWASDWNPMTPDQQLNLVLERLEAAGRGIVLFHDTKQQTARMLPAFLRELKRRGYSVVHIVSR